MKQLSNFLLKQNKIKEAIKEIKENKKTEISEASKEIASLILSCLIESNINKNILVVAPNMFQAQKLYDSLSQISDNVFFYPKDDFISIELLTESFDFKLQRINALKNIFTNNNKSVYVTCLTALLSKLPQKEFYKSKIISFKKGTKIKPKDLLNTLIEAGYERNYTVEKQGEISLRGGIFDCFPINDTKAYRVDFFGDEIDSIKVFDVETQRSVHEVFEVLVMPKNEILFSEQEIETIKFFINDKLGQDISEKTKEKYESDLEYLEETGEYSLLQKYLSIFLKDNYSFADYLDDKIVVYFDYEFVQKQELNINNQIYDYLSNFQNYFSIDSFLNNLSQYTFEKELYFTTKKKIHELKEISFHSKDLTNYDNRFDLFIQEIGIELKKKTIIVSLPDKKYDIFKDFLIQNQFEFIDNPINIKENKLNLLLSDKGIAFYVDDINAISYTDDKLFKNTSTKKEKYQLSVETKRLKSLSELKIGDYVVHYDYGIGKFQEITTMSIRGKENDYIHIKYEGDQSVYIPVEKLHVLSKYAGSETYVPKLSNLNSKEWEKTKNNARQKAGELAKRLLSIYSDREKNQGFEYFEDDETQIAFENDFGYELTKDQAQAIEDVKKDMESSKLMDRLICGDVGFGKTEVALRAAFKAVLSGKQVAYLAPTTVLARQHYHTFIERMSKYGVNVALVSRFVQPQVIKTNLHNLSRGVVDIIIGTHRLLSDDVEFKNLGLLIIDEEQRFGVESKEKMKELKNNIDVLTLTATPIPRTLQMAVTGLKNVSLIETAPKGRYPIQTYVLERNDYIVKDAIEREISKGGQVFYLYNRVEDMDKIVSYVHTLVPEARINTIHGQMDRKEIEETIESFINQEADILISTTIIETGVDIPNANTLIVHDADRYGLAQLYQIKGRVGRSDKIAYAYMMYDKAKTLTEDAQKRLQAIKDFAELGSGFKIAVRDLTNRGAGEILGKEQSGFMDRVGVDLYLKMLDEEIKKEKGETCQKPKENVLILMSRHIDKEYVSDDYVLIEIHDKISKLNSVLDLNKLIEELTDRFGKLKDGLIEYMYTKLAENLINSIEFERVETGERNILFVLSVEKSKTVDAQSLFKYAAEISNNFIFYFKVQRIFVGYNTKQSKLEMYRDVSVYLENIKNDFII